MQKKFPDELALNLGNFADGSAQAILAERPRIVILHYCKMREEYADENSFVNTSAQNYWLNQKRYF
jgi:hypothetical protein